LGRRRRAVRLRVRWVDSEPIQNMTWGERAEKRMEMVGLILEARKAKGLTWAEIAAKVGKS
jgi:hypothetical protein